MIELHDVNTALTIYNRRLRLVVDYALQVFDICERDLALFITPKAREMIVKSRDADTGGGEGDFGEQGVVWG